jgi:hypothetical protein
VVGGDGSATVKGDLDIGELITPPRSTSTDQSGMFVALATDARGVACLSSSSQVYTWREYPLWKRVAQYLVLMLSEVQDSMSPWAQKYLLPQLVRRNPERRHLPCKPVQLAMDITDLTFLDEDNLVWCMPAPNRVCIGS